MVPNRTGRSEVPERRCSWAGEQAAMLAYHDLEWGVPVRDDRLLFEFLILEGAQAGLSWSTILNKRDNYRRLFENFNAEKVAHFDEARKQALLADAGIIRNRLKIEAAIGNARALLEIVAETGSFSDWLWRFVDGRTIQNRWRTLAEIPAQTPESEAMSRELKRRGFRFVGPTICYALMQATGMVNDHTVDCFRHQQLS